jgi:hypothetical protein
VIDYYKGQNIIGAIWGVFSIILFLVVVLQTLGGKHGTHNEEVWAWFLPSILPTAMLIVGVYVKDAFVVHEAKRVRKTAFTVSLIASLLYLCLLALLIFTQPLWSPNFPELIKKTAFFIGPLQGLVAAALGVFFTQPKQG